MRRLVFLAVILIIMATSRLFYLVWLFQILSRDRRLNNQPESAAMHNN